MTERERNGESERERSKDALRRHRRTGPRSCYRADSGEQEKRIKRPRDRSLASAVLAISARLRRSATPRRTRAPSRRTMRSAAVTPRQHSGHRPPPQPHRPAHIRPAHAAAAVAAVGV